MLQSQSPKCLDSVFIPEMALVAAKKMVHNMKISSSSYAL
jgi:hypothetical protein